MFFQEYIKNPMKIGAIAPSSKKLAKKMIAPIDFENSKCIVEFGPGTGVFTEEIVNHKKEETLFLVIEQNAKFCSELKKKYNSVKNMHIIEGDASKILHYLEHYNHCNADYIISGLPFTSLPKSITQNILTATHKAIGNSGKFVTFQYSLFKKKVFLKYFTLSNTSFVFQNLPPAFILEMINESK